MNRKFAIALPILFTAALSNAASSFKPLDSVTLKFFFADEKVTFLEGQSGLKLKQGANLFLFEDGFYKPGDKTVFYYQLKQTMNHGERTSEVFRAYFKYTLAKISLEAGQDSVNIGPGKYGILLSNNAAPFPMLKLQTEEKLRFAGLWDFTILNGWLNEKRVDTDNPRIFLVRLGWQPVNWLEIAGTRNTMYGGTGRPGYKIWEFPALFAGVNENTSGGRFDNDGYVGWDATIHLPAAKWSGGRLKTAKLYYSDNGTDMRAFWQKEDRHMKYYFPFGFRFMLTAYVGGVLLETEKDSFRFEFANTNPLFYVHSNYNREGYTYKGLSLGEPYGRNIQHAFFTHNRKLSGTTSFEYTLGYLKQPAFKAKGETAMPPSMERYYLAAGAARTSGSVMLEPYLRIDLSKKHDTEPLPTQYDIAGGDRVFLTAGTSATFKF